MVKNKFSLPHSEHFSSDFISSIRFGALLPMRHHGLESGRSCSPPHGEGRRSPFQMPARLAVGLGPESDRANGSHSRLPRPDYSGIGSPALTCRKASQLSA